MLSSENPSFAHQTPLYFMQTVFVNKSQLRPWEKQNHRYIWTPSCSSHSPCNLEPVPPSSLVHNRSRAFSEPRSAAGCLSQAYHSVALLPTPFPRRSSRNTTLKRSLTRSSSKTQPTSLSSLPLVATSLTTWFSNSMMPTHHNLFPPIRPSSLPQISRLTVSVNELRLTCTPVPTHLITIHSNNNENIMAVSTHQTPSDLCQYTHTATRPLSYPHSRR